MPPESVVQRAFGGGELAPVMHVRADEKHYATGARTIRNFIILRGGGVANRSGWRYTATCKTNNPSVQLVRYVSENAGDSIAIEAGNNYLRFFKDGAPVTVTGVAAWSGVTTYVQGDLASRLGVNYYCILGHLNQQPPNATYWYALTDDIYEIPTPFGANGLFNWVQSGRVITMTHSAAPPHELHFVSLTNWVLLPITTTPGIAAPVNLAAVAGAAGTRTFAYAVTAVFIDTYEESLPSTADVIATAAEPTPDAPNTLTWDPVTDAIEYYVYCDPYGNGVYGFIGTAATNAFNDVGFVPDFAVTPPIPRVLFATTDNYPDHAAYYQQRRLFAYTTAEPDAIWGSRVGFHSNFSISSPLQDDDSLTFKIAGNNHHPVRHLVALKSLLVGTDGGEWVIGDGKTPLTPSYIPADQHTYDGAHDKKPVIAGHTMIYIQARGSILRDLRFDQQVEGLGGRDLTLFASHLFDGRSIGRIDYAHTPHSIVWATTGGGNLLGLTYIPELDVWGWHRHDTGANGEVEDICVIPENDEDALYGIVKRTIEGATVRYIERMASRTIGAGSFDEDVFFVDSGLSYSGAPATVFAGLEHLEGQIVAVVADGAVVFNGDPTSASAATYTVTGGEITIPTAATEVHIGLPIIADLETLDLDVGGSSIRDKQKKVGSVNVVVDRSSRGFWAGPDSAHLYQAQRPSYEAAADEHTGQIEVNLSSSFDRPGRVFVRHTEPTPLAILGIIPNIEIGG